jgi:hypothetical protein
MKKFFIIAGMILAVMTVVQPSYATNAKTFNIVVTVSNFSMKLLHIDGEEYGDWHLTVPPSGVYTMMAEDAVMVSLTGDLQDHVDIFTSVDNTDNWNAILPGMTFQDNDFILEVAAMNTMPTNPLTASGFIAITQDTMAPAKTIPTNGLQEATTFLIYKLHIGPSYPNKNANLNVKVEASALQ